MLSGILAPLVAAAVLVAFLSSVSELSEGHSREDRERLEDALRRAAVACYCVEGAYPPDLKYLEERYGIQIDRQRYTVSYVPVAENLMPDITVLEK
jgi:hypothetical protein